MRNSTLEVIRDDVFYFAPADTPTPPTRAELDAPDGAWKRLGFVSLDPITDALTQVGEAADQARTVLVDFSQRFEVQFGKINPRAIRRYFGIYRPPGGKPLLHKGRKWRH